MAFCCAGKCSGAGWSREGLEAEVEVVMMGFACASSRSSKNDVRDGAQHKRRVKIPILLCFRAGGLRIVETRKRSPWHELRVQGHDLPFQVEPTP